MNPMVSVIIVSFNCENDLKQCLESFRTEKEHIEVFVIDNASQDGTREMLEREFNNWTELRVIYNSYNAGLTRANNQAIPECHGKYILFLNPDTIIKPDDIQKLASYLDMHPSVGAIGPKMCYADGSFQFSFGSFWTLRDMAILYLLPSYKRFRLPFIARYRHADWVSYYEGKEVDWISEGCLMIRRNIVIELGGFDENIFLSLSDCVDMCFRLRQKGYRVVYYPKVEIIHTQGVSTERKETMVEVLLYAHQGHLYYFKKHHGIASANVLRGIFFLSDLEKAIITGLLGLIKPKQYWPLFKAHFIALLKILILPIPGD